MSDLLEQLRGVTENLDELNIRYALVGGLAVSLYAEPRFTRDMDVAVAVGSDDEAEQLGRELMNKGYRIFAQVEQDRATRLATLRLELPRTTGIVVDLLFASCGIEPEIVEHAERMEALPGWVAPVARPEHLLAMKLLASDPPKRPQDLIDARALLRAMSSEQIDAARRAIDLITKRGFNRGKDLAKELEELLNDQ